MHGGSIFGRTAAARVFRVLYNNRGTRFSTLTLEEAAEVKAGSTRVSEVDRELKLRGLPLWIKREKQRKTRMDGGLTVIWYYTMHNQGEGGE